MDESSLIRELLGFFDKGQISALLVISAAILLTTQFLKLTMQRFYRKPSAREIHLVSFASALFFGASLWPNPMIAQKVLAIILGWSMAAGIATYGLRLTAEFFPRIHKVLQMDRRKGDAGPPQEGDRREPKP